MKDLFNTTMAFMGLAAFTLSGCTDVPDDSQFTEITASDNEQPDETSHAGHAHPSHGPHDGDLIELGNEEYHAELVHPHDHGHEEHGQSHSESTEASSPNSRTSDDHEPHAITVYILDRSAKDAVPIDAHEVTLNLTLDGKPKQFKLAATPDQGDPEGQSSRFVSSDEELIQYFRNHEHIEGTLVLSIDGKSYRGRLTHDHHDDHGHDHGSTNEPHKHAH